MITSEQKLTIYTKTSSPVFNGVFSTGIILQYRIQCQTCEETFWILLKNIKLTFSLLVLTKKNCLHGLSAVTDCTVFYRPVVALHSEPSGTGQSSKALQLRSSIHCTAHRPYDARKDRLVVLNKVSCLS